MIALAPALVAALLQVPPSGPPPITSIDTWGVRTVDVAALEAAVGVELGSREILDREAIRSRIVAVDGVVEAGVVEIWAGAGRIVMVGVRETGAPRVPWRPAPTGDVRLPDGLVALYERSMALLAEALEARVLGEDHVDGYALSQFEPRRALELAVVERAPKDAERVSRVLRESSDAGHRAAAAWARAYGPDKAAIVDDLVYAVTDADSTVRNNATRALGILVEHLQESGDGPVALDPAPIVAMLGSTEWTDLNKASFLLLSLTGRPAPGLLDALRETALDGLADIARWKSEGHAYPGLLVLARLAGLDDGAARERIGPTRDDRPARLALVDELLARSRAAAED